MDMANIHSIEEGVRLSYSYEVGLCMVGVPEDDENDTYIVFRNAIYARNIQTGQLQIVGPTTSGKFSLLPHQQYGLVTVANIKDNEIRYIRYIRLSFEGNVEYGDVEQDN